MSRNVSEGTSFFFFLLSRFLLASLSPLFSLKFEALFSSLLPAPTPLSEAMQCSLAQSTRVAVPTARRGAVVVRAAARPER